MTSLPRRVVLDTPSPAKKPKSTRVRKPRPFMLNLRQVADPRGIVLTTDGQRYLLTRVERKDDTIWLVWETHCATCGVLFEATTGRNLDGYITRRCLEHRSVGRLRHDPQCSQQ